MVLKLLHQVIELSAPLSQHISSLGTSSGPGGTWMRFTHLFGLSNPLLPFPLSKLQWFSHLILNLQRDPPAPNTLNDQQPQYKGIK